MSKAPNEHTISEDEEDVKESEGKQQRLEFKKAIKKQHAWTESCGDLIPHTTQCKIR
jgi:hypothetical protein